MDAEEVVEKKINKEPPRKEPKDASENL